MSQEVLDDTPFLPPAVVELCAWVADYYMAGMGDAVAVALPPGAKARASSYKTRQLVSLTAHGMAALEDSSRPRLRSGRRRPHRQTAGRRCRRWPAPPGCRSRSCASAA